MKWVSSLWRVLGGFRACQLSEFQVNTQRCCCVDYFPECHGFPWMHFSMLSSIGVTMFQCPKQFGDDMSGRS